MAPRQLYLSEWILENNRKDLSKRLNVKLGTLSHWSVGFCRPTVWAMLRIVEVSKNRVSYSGIIDDPVQRNRGSKKRAKKGAV